MSLRSFSLITGNVGKLRKDNFSRSVVTDEEILTRSFTRPIVRRLLYGTRDCILFILLYSHVPCTWQVGG